MSFATPTTQCKGETWGSSISMSAPPPVRPMLVLALVSWCFRPFEEPAMTEIVIVLSLGSARPDDRLEIEASSESAFLANNASSSRSASWPYSEGPQVVLKFKRPLCCAVKTHSPLPVVLVWHYL